MTANGGAADLPMRTMLLILVAGILAGTGFPPPQSDNPPERVFAGYFDIRLDSPAGTEVTGRIQPKRNRRAPDVPVPADFRFKIVRDQSEGLFVLSNERDDEGRLFGLFRVAPKKAAVKGTHELEVALESGKGLLARSHVKIHAAPQTQWEIYHDKAIAFAMHTGRLTGRRRYKDEETTRWIEHLEKNRGAFDDLSFYRAGDRKALLEIGRNKLAEETEEAANRMGGLGYAYARSRKYGPQGTREDRDRLRRALYLAVSAYVNRFPIRDFANFPGIPFSHRSHAWRFTDPFSGMSALLTKDLLEDERKGVPEAKKAREAMIRFLQNVNFDAPAQWCKPDWSRYFTPDRWDRSGGTFGDANRGHRIRSWAMMPVIWHDYNRPLTDLPIWYDDCEPMAAKGTTLLPGWKPSGSFADLSAWLETNTIYPHRYGQSGILPDGSISHHIGSRQDMAMDAYGMGWMSGETFSVMAMLADTPWKVSAGPFNESADFYLFAYPWMVYRGGLDFQTSGRGHDGSHINAYGSYLPRSINNILKGRSRDTVVKRLAELEAFRDALKEGSQECDGCIAFWCNDYLIQRRGGGKGKPSWFMSFKMQSARTRGAECFSRNTGFHNGSGILQVMVEGREYADTRFAWDWHALPGLTEELRTDTLPMQSENHGFSPHVYAGTASNGRCGLAAFHYGTGDPYTSATAFKSCFFTNSFALAMGSEVRRVRNTDGSDAEPILTTIDQAPWDTDLVYRISEKETRLPKGRKTDTLVEIKSDAWFHQDRIGYIVFAETPVRVRLKGGEAVTDTPPPAKKPMDLFHLAIDHGINPDGSGPTGRYRYLVIPDIGAEEMPTRYEKIKAHLRITQTDEIHALHYVEGTTELFQAACLGRNIPPAGPLREVDGPALVQLQKTKEGWSITAADPTHHAPDGPKARQRIFTHPLRSGPNEINLVLDLPLQPGTYRYMTQGRDPRFIEGQIVEVKAEGNGASRLRFHLPDTLDREAYDRREELHAGMPAVVTAKSR